MTKRITLELSVDSCNKVIKELEEYQTEIKPKLDEVCRRLAEIGYRVAQAHLALGYGNTGASISPPIKSGNGYRIALSGEDVYFVEFGTGDQVSPHFETSVPVAWGSWSSEHAQKLVKYGFWWYGGEKLTGTPASMPMYYASKAIRDAVPKIVKEVFSE